MSFTMSEEQKNEIWAKVLGEIQTEVSRPIFVGLFKNTQLLSLENNIATIAASSSITINLLRSRYETGIKKILDKHTKENITVLFVPKSVSQDKNKDSGPLFTDVSEKEQTRNVLHRSLSRVRAEYTFETLAVSPSNQLAFVSAQTVAKNIGGSYNPLFMYGPVGVGK